MYEFNCILKTDLKNLYTNPMWWAGTIGLPLLLALVMGFITKGTYGGVVTSFDYYAITMMIFGALNNATLAANSFMETRIVKANMRLCTFIAKIYRSVHKCKYKRCTCRISYLANRK